MENFISNLEDAHIMLRLDSLHRDRNLYQWKNPKATQTHTNVPTHAGAHERLPPIQSPHYHHHHHHHHHHQYKYLFPLASNNQAIRYSIQTPPPPRGKLFLREQTRPNQLYGMPTSVVNLRNASLDSLAGLDVC